MSLFTTTTNNNNNRLLSLLLLVGLTAFPNVVAEIPGCIPGTSTPCLEPEGGQCPTDTFVCPDGSVVTRDPLLNCEFQRCGVEENTSGLVTCEGLYPKLCPDGVTLTFPDPANNCLYTDCGTGIINNCVVGCELPPFPCPDGTTIYPDYCACTYPECPPIPGFNRKLLRGAGKSESTTTVNGGERKA